MTKPLTGRDNDFLRIVLPACGSGSLIAVKAYTADTRGFVRWIGPHGRTMLWEAARKGRLPTIEYLDREHQADPRAIGCYYRETRIEVSPWLVATLNGHVETADYLASRDAGMDFHSALYLGDVEFVNAVINRDPEAADRAWIRDHPWNGYLVYPLQYAVVGKQLDMAELLLDHGANAAHPQILFDAIDTGQLKITDLLLAHGADPKTTRHRSWLEDPAFNALARRHGHDIREVDVPPQKWPEIVDAARGNHNAPDDPARVARLIQRGHDVCVRDYKGKTALHRASQAGFLNISKLLLENGADIEARSHDGETPLFDAA
ncbi:MAG: ankyrin repeat domain-containing protein, partial [Pirellulaceae bacterium]